MARVARKSLELDEDLRFQRRQWQWERIAWLVMAGFVAYSLAGGFGGGGPLSSANVASADGTVRVHYERFARQLTPNSVHVTVRQPPDGRPAQIHLSGDYLSSMTVKSAVPEPDTTTVAENGYLFAFKRLPGVVETKIDLQLEPQEIGSVQGWLTINNGERLAIKQFVFP
jgi:hypothetical protein